MNYLKSFALTGLMVSLLISCSKEEKLDSTSVFVDSKVEKNDLDKYIYTNFTIPYNLDIIYKYVDRESDLNYNLVPATYDASVRLVKLINYLGLEPYNDLTGSKEFIRSNFPKVLNFIGSSPIQNNGNVILGTAENGAKMTLYNLMNLNACTATNASYLTEQYFKTIHHEFQHILNQRKPFPSDFRAITGTTYVDDAWATVYTSNGAAIAAGYVSRYASKAPEEDFAELFSIYVTRSQAAFDAALSVTGSTAAGRTLVLQKLNIVKTYMKDKWNIDMDALRSNYLDRASKLSTFDQTTIK